MTVTSLQASGSKVCYRCSFSFDPAIDGHPRLRIIISPSTDETVMVHYAGVIHSDGYGVRYTCCRRVSNSHNTRRLNCDVWIQQLSRSSALSAFNSLLDAYNVKGPTLMLKTISCTMLGLIYEAHTGHAVTIIIMIHYNVHSGSGIPSTKIHEFVL